MKYTKQQQQRDSQMQTRSSDESRRRRNRDIIHAKMSFDQKGKSATKRETREARCTKATTTVYPSPTADG
jgi:hypothetical protein